MNGEATINLEDGQIRFWPAERLPKDEYNEVRSIGLRWKRGEQCFMGPWSPRKVDFLAEKFGITELDEDGTDLIALAERRAEYYSGYSDNAARRSDERHEASKAAVAGIPLGQPILVGHHSERAHRNAIKRAQDNATKAYVERQRSEYWKHRAERAVKAQEYKQRPGVISRRIDKLEAQLRKHQRNLDKERWLVVDAPWYEHRGQDLDEVWNVVYTFNMRWVEFLEERIAFQKALYEASGGILADSIDFEVGDYVNSWHGWATIIRVNKKSVTIDSKWGNGRIKYNEITGHRKADDNGR